eukprot:3172295-Amphidinium_carterae.1
MLLPNSERLSPLPDIRSAHDEGEKVSDSSNLCVELHACGCHLQLCDSFSRVAKATSNGPHLKST